MAFLTHQGRYRPVEGSIYNSEEDRKKAALVCVLHARDHEEALSFLDAIGYIEPDKETA